MLADIRLTDAGDLPVPGAFVSRGALVAQRVRVRLRTFVGDWLLDGDAGLPWLAWLATKPPPVPVIVQRVREEIASTPGVESVDEVVGAFDPVTRTISITGSATVDDGSELAAAIVLGGKASGTLSPGALSIRVRPIPLGFGGSP